MSPRQALCLSLVVLCLQAAGAVPAHAVEAGPVASAFSDVGIDQKLGSSVALDTTFTGENGERVRLRDLVTKPTILALVYYTCPNVCDYLLTGLAGVLGPLSAQPGVDYNVVTISIDPAETPAEARKAKRIGLESIQKPFPPAAWRFLTGNEENVHAVAESVGFHYMRNGDGFDHPVALIILSPGGRITRYMFGADFLAADLRLSLLEAQRGAIGPTIAKLARICFRVDPKSHTLVFRTTRVVATVTLVCAAALVSYLLVSSRRKKRRVSGS
jgi:protein SCO1/2